MEDDGEVNGVLVLKLHADLVDVVLVGLLYLENAWDCEDHPDEDDNLVEALNDHYLDEEGIQNALILVERLAAALPVLARLLG